MSVQSRLEDAQVLYENGRCEGALLTLLVAVAATARKRYLYGKYGDKEAFTKFVQDEQATIIGSVSQVTIHNLFIGYKGKTMRFPDLLYEILRCKLVHEGTMPDDIQFIRDDKVLMQVGGTVKFNAVLLQGLANAVLLAPENQEPMPEVAHVGADNPATVLAHVYKGALDLRRVLRWQPPGPEDKV